MGKSVSVTSRISSILSREKINSLASQPLPTHSIMDTFAALALATDPASRTSLDRKPDRKTAPLLNPDMIKMILAQATYQTIVCFVLHFAGDRILGIPGDDDGHLEKKALVFNVFVFCQICELGPVFRSA